MENPRKRSHRGGRESAEGRGHVVDLRAYQSRRRRDNKGKKRTAMYSDKKQYLLFLCYGLVGATIILSIFGLIPSTWQTKSLIWGLFTATLGLGCGLWFHSRRARWSWLVLKILAASFAFAYLCAIAKFFI